MTRGRDLYEPAAGESEVGPRMLFGSEGVEAGMVLPSRAAVSPAEAERMIYDAFISYSHKRDKPIASALQSLVQRLGKPWYTRRAARVFRDDTSLSATPQLWASIERALGASRYFLLFASPDAAQSPWVAKECRYWLDHRSVETFLIALTAGELAWDDAAGDFVWSDETPLPPLLRRRFGVEPKWVDMRSFRSTTSPLDQKFMECSAELAAAVRGIRKEDLLSEEVRQQRRALRLAWSAATIMLLLAVGVGVAGRIAAQQRDRALQTLAVTTENANGLVVDVATKVRRTVGIPVATQREILKRTEDLQHRLLVDWPGNMELARSQAIVHRELAQTLLLVGDAGGALQSAKHSREKMKELLARNPSKPSLVRSLQRELSLSYNRIGEAQSALGHLEQALAAYSRALEIRQGLADGAADAELQRDLALSYERTGDALFALERIEDARQAYQKSFDLREELDRVAPTAEHRADLAVGFERLARSAPPSEALELHRKSLAIREKLVAEEPRDAFWQRDLAASYDHVGDALLRLGERDGAIAAFQKSLDIREALTARNPDFEPGQINLAVSLANLGDAGDGARERYRRALDVLTLVQDPSSRAMELRRYLEDKLAALEGNTR